MLGWGPLSLMQDLIKELDHGLSALPEGSEVTFVNTHNPHDSLGQALENVTLENIRVCCCAACMTPEGVVVWCMLCNCVTAWQVLPVTH